MSDSNPSRNECDSSGAPEAWYVRDGWASLPGLLYKISHPVRPRVLAYLGGLLFVCLAAFYETKFIDACNDCIVSDAAVTHIPDYRQTFMPDYDSLRWIVFTQESWRAGSWYRLNHWTYSDNYPDGRFVGWSSPPMWWLEFLAGIRHLRTGEDMLVAIDEVAPYYNIWLYIATALVLGGIFVKVLGWRGAFIVPLITSLTFFGIYGAFSCDYHFWMILTGIGTIVCLAKPFLDGPRCNAAIWFLLSAVFCSLGIWICAPSQTLVIIGIFLGLAFLPADSLRGVDSANWRLWGYAVSLLSLGAYFFEFRRYWPLNVELNSPVYAGGALVAGIWMWQIHEFILNGRYWKSLNGRWLAYSALGLFVLVLPLVVYMPYCFSMTDPYRNRWDAMVSDIQPMRVISYCADNAFRLVLPLMAATVALFLNRKERGPGLNAIVAFVVGNIFVSAYLGVSSYRFFAFTIACMAIYVTLALPCRKKDALGWILASILILNGFGYIHDKIATTRDTGVFGMNSYFGGYLLGENISNEMLLRGHTDHAVVLAPVNEACIINYYTDVPVLGMGYWENHPMMVDVLRVFFYERNGSGDQWDYAQSYIRRQKVTTVIVPKNINYARSYTIYGNRRIVDGSKTFAFYLINVDRKNLVPWLRLDFDSRDYRMFTVVNSR